MNNRIKLSTNITPIDRWFNPILISFVLLVILYFTFKDFPQLHIIGLGIPVMSIVLLLHLNTARRIAEVEMDDEFLYIIKGYKQAQVPLSEVLVVDYEFDSKFKLFEQAIMIEFRHTTAIGKKIYIKPKGYGNLFSDHNTVNEIKVRMQENKLRKDPNWRKPFSEYY